MITQDDIDAFESYHDADFTFDAYQKTAADTAIYPTTTAILYPALGLSGEAGEVANKVKKIVRDKELDREGIAAELGDCLWYIAALCRDLNVEMSVVAKNNIAKLKARKEKGTLKGSGDKR